MSSSAIFSCGRPVTEGAYRLWWVWPPSLRKSCAAFIESTVFRLSLPAFFLYMLHGNSDEQPDNLASLARWGWSGSDHGLLQWSEAFSARYRGEFLAGNSVQPQRLHTLAEHQLQTLLQKQPQSIYFAASPSAGPSFSHPPLVLIFHTFGSREVVFLRQEEGGAWRLLYTFPGHSQHRR